MGARVRVFLLMILEYGFEDLEGQMGNGREGYSMLSRQDQAWRVSNIMKIPNTNLLEQLGGTARLGGRLWRLPPFSANTWHRHIDQWELYFVLEGTGRMRIGKDTVTVS